MGQQIELYPNQAAQAALADDQKVGPLELSDDQAQGLRALARRLRQEYLDAAEAIRADRHYGKTKRSDFSVIFGHSEGIVKLVAALLDDETILDDPDDNL